MIYRVDGHGVPCPYDLFFIRARHAVPLPSLLYTGTACRAPRLHIVASATVNVCLDGMGIGKKMLFDARAGLIYSTGSSSLPTHIAAIRCMHTLFDGAPIA